METTVGLIIVSITGTYLLLDAFGLAGRRPVAEPGTAARRKKIALGAAMLVFGASGLLAQYIIGND